MRAGNSHLSSLLYQPCTAHGVHRAPYRTVTSNRYARTHTHTHRPKITFVTTRLLRADRSYVSRLERYLPERADTGKSEIQISRWRSQIVRMNSRIDKQRIEEPVNGRNREKERDRLRARQADVSAIRARHGSV